VRGLGFPAGAHYPLGMKNALAALAVSLGLAAPALAETVTVASGGKNHVFNVDVAETKAAAEAGLKGRTDIPKDGGLLIDHRKTGDFTSPTMKGVMADLDLLFIAADGTVVATIQHARAGSLRPLWVGLGMAATLEIPAGQVAALGLKPGDRVRGRMFGNAG